VDIHTNTENNGFHPPTQRITIYSNGILVCNERTAGSSVHPSIHPPIIDFKKAYKSKISLTLSVGLSPSIHPPPHRPPPT